MSLPSLLLISALLFPGGPAGPLTADMVKKRQEAAALIKAIEAEGNPAGKIGRIAAAIKGEKDVEVRRKLIELAATIPGKEREEFLIAQVKSEDDSLLRSEIATMLGK